MTVEGGGKVGSRLAYQVGLADAREVAGQRRDATGLRLAAGDPENVLETGERPGSGIRIGRLGIIDEQHGSLAADLLHPVSEPGERLQPALDRLGIEPERQRRAG